MNPLIECCIQNITSNHSSFMSDETVNQSADILIYSCTNHCSLCAQKNYILFEGKPISADTPHELLLKTKEALILWENE